MSTCHLHPQRETLGGCTSCGRFVCEICLNKVQGKIVCDSCMRLQSTQQALQRHTSGPLNVNTSPVNIPPSLHELQQRFMASNLPGHALQEVKKEVSSLSQRNLLLVNTLVTMMTLVALDSLAIIFWLPACIGLWYFWNKRRQQHKGIGKARTIVQEIFQIAMLNNGEISLGQLAAQGHYTMDEYEDEVHKLTARGVIRQELDEEHGIIKYYMQ